MCPSRLVRTALPLAAAVLLAGCSGTVTPGGGTGPGVALQVADDSVRLDEVDRASEGVCLGVLPQLEQDGQVLPLGEARRYVVRTLTTRLLTEQWAAERGVEAGALYERRLNELDVASRDMPADVRDEYVRVESSAAFANDVHLQVGRTELQAAGDAAPTDELAFQAGFAAFQAWVVERTDEVDLDPRFGLALGEGGFVDQETGTSVAVSDAAVQGAAEQIDPAYVSTLPENQRCG